MGAVGYNSDVNVSLEPRGSFKMNKILPLLLGSALTLCSNLVAAQDVSKPTPQRPDEPNPQIIETAPAEVEKTLKTNCYTSQQGCEGMATFGNFNYDVGCSIWYRDGAGGRANFRVNALKTLEEHVRYNDTCACVALQYAPPKDRPRFYIYVHN
jgi:hypothetical protein